MVQIPEYTRRENARPVQRGGMNLSLPDALVKPVGTEAIEKGLKLSKELADVYVNMKERRDDGIVSGFLNQYSKDAEAKLLELEDKYRGQNSQKVMSEFQKWRDDYIAQHSSYDPDSAKEGVIYLENAAQNRLAKEKLDAYNVRDINSISSYIAQEEEKFRVNNINANVADNIDHIINDDNPLNAEISKANIAANINSLYKGQPDKYKKRIYDDILDNAFYGNIMRDSAINPMASIDRYMSPVFSKNLRPETSKKTHEQLLKSFITYQAQQLANAQTGREANPAGQTFYERNKQFFGNDLDKIKEIINENAVKLQNSIVEQDNRYNNAVINNLDNQLYNAILNGDEQKKAEILSALSGVKGGVENANLINNSFKELNDYEFLLKAKASYESILLPESYEEDMQTKLTPEQNIVVDGVVAPEYSEVEKRLKDYRMRRIFVGAGRMPNVINAINNDKYDTLLDIPNFAGFMPDQKATILRAFINKARYNSLSETTEQKSGVNFDSRIYEIFKNGRGDPNKNPVEYNRFKLEMSTQILRYLEENQNKIPTAKDLQMFAKNATVMSRDDVVNKPAKDMFVSIANSIEDKIGKDNKHRDYSTLYNTARELIMEKLNSYSLSLSETKALDKATYYFVDGDWEEAYDILADAELLERQSFEYQPEDEIYYMNEIPKSIPKSQNSLLESIAIGQQGF